MDHPVLDPHIHLWDVHNNPRLVRPLVRLFGWNDRVLRFMAKRLFPADLVAFFGVHNHAVVDYFPADYLGDAAPAGIDRYVHIQAGWRDRRPLDPVGETVWLEELRQNPRAGARGPDAIVAYADLALGDAVGEVLAAHRAASPVVRGIRYMLTWHAHPRVHSFAPRSGLARDETWRRGFAALAAHDLSFDAWVYHDQLLELAELAAAFPDTRVALCHAGTPIGLGGPFHGLGASVRERERIRGAWIEGLRAVAACPNVVCKLSGLTMPVLGFGFHERARKPDKQALEDTIAPLLRTVLDVFGVERCMFASNFPVDKVSVELDTLWALYAEVAAEFDAHERQALFHDNAAAFYRVDPT